MKGVPDCRKTVQKNRAENATNEVVACSSRIERGSQQGSEYSVKIPRM
jgi:hypothetical protein